MTKLPTDAAIHTAPIRYAATLATVALAYFVLAKLGLLLATINPSASPIWPPSGLALAAVLLGRPRVWPAIYAGAFAANLVTAGNLETSAVIALGNTLEALAGAGLIDRRSSGAGVFATPAGVAKFGFVSLGPASIVGATIGVTTLCVAGLAAWDNYFPVWITWWMGDAAGMLVLTPVLVLWAQADRHEFSAQEWYDTAAVLALAILVGLIAFSPLPPRTQYTVPLAFLAILPLVWAALRRGPRDTATVVLVLTGFAIWGALISAGPFREMGRNEVFLLLLAFMISISLPSLALSAAVTLRRQTEEALRQHQAELDARVRERTAALTDANIHLSEAQRLANLGSWSWDVESDRVVWSDPLCEIYGIRPGTFGGRLQDFLAFVHPDDRAAVTASVESALKTGGRFKHDERILRPDGSIRHLQSAGEVICGEAGRPVRVLGVCLDVTERKQAEQALHDSEQSYGMLLRGVRDYAIYMLDADGRIRTWNEGARRLKGYTAEEIVGRHIRELLPPENRASGLADQELAAASREGQCIAQTWVMRKDGSHFYADIVIDALRNDAGELIGFAKLVRDITTQREAQIALETTREQLAQAQKMEALGQLTGGIAHDFNNLLMIVSGYAQILQRRLSDEKHLQAVQAIRAAADRGEKLTRQLLTFSRRQQLSPVVVDLRARIDAVRDMLTPSLHANIALACEVADDVWSVEVDLGELELALVNIIVNARDALPEGGTITVSAANVTLEQGVLAGVPEGDFVAIAVVDTGEGIAPDVLKRVFEPFFTTKPVGKGTGLGLSQVHGFASQSGGAVTIVSEPGRGTTVTIYLPRSRAAVAAQTGLERIEQSAVAQGTVLVVEDNPDVAAVSSLLLEQLGYSVVGVENASEALALLEQGSRPDLIFSDIVVPGPIDGLGLAQICRERYPDIPVLLTSGYSDAARDAEARFDILRKPFELSALARAIDGVRRRG